MDISLIIPAFIAGLLMFLAPCTLPLVPGYLGFISGVSVKEFGKLKKSTGVQRQIFFNALLYVTGFSLVFILLGVLFGLGGAALLKYRLVLSRVGGIVVLLFGLYMIFSNISLFKQVAHWRIFSWLEKEHRLPINSWFKPGHKLSSFFFGATFAFGWSPCIGPVLGSVLLLASQTTTVGQGAFLLFVFSLGLAIPFLLLALSLGKALQFIHRIGPYLQIVSILGGIFLLIMGILLITDSFATWTQFFYQIFDKLNYDRLLDYL